MRFTLLPSIPQVSQCAQISRLRSVPHSLLLHPLCPLPRIKFPDHPRHSCGSLGRHFVIRQHRRNRSTSCNAILFGWDLLVELFECSFPTFLVRTDSAHRQRQRLVMFRRHSSLLRDPLYVMTASPRPVSFWRRDGDLGRGLRTFHGCLAFTDRIGLTI